jgi:hypothetical protein
LEWLTEAANVVLVARRAEMSGRPWLEVYRDGELQIELAFPPRDADAVYRQRGGVDVPRSLSVVRARPASGGPLEVTGARLVAR